MKENTENHLNILMQGIAASASEFLQKPFSEERLKNIWQHVVRKALVTKHMAMPTEIASSCCKGANPTSNENDNLLNIKQEVTRDYKQALDEMPDAQLFFQQEDQSLYFYLDEKDNCDALLCSTAPQLQQSSRLPTEKAYPDGSSSLTHGFSVACMKGDLDNDCFDDCDNFLHIKSLQGEDAADYNSTILNYLFDSKAKDDYFLNHDLDDPTLCADLQFDDLPDSLDNITLSSDLVDGDVISGLDTNQSLCKGFDCLDDEYSQAADGEVLLLAEIAMSEKGRINPRIGSQSIRIKPVNGSISRDIEESNSKSDSEQSWNKGSKISSGKSKKTKVDWTPELHRRFVQAVEQLGVDKAIPSKILELMAVKCLTRHNVASHLQKYRAHRKHLLTREAEAASWNHRRQREAAAAAARHDRHARPAPAARPPQRIQPRRAHAPAPLSLAAGPPPLHVWGHPTVEHAAMQFWPAWPMPACQLDAWGNLFYPRQPPVLRMPLAPISSVANMAVSPHADGKQASLHPPRETVNAAISEVLRNPCIALPLGLRPPSLESVVSELQRRGISMVPPAPF